MHFGVVAAVRTLVKTFDKDRNGTVDLAPAAGKPEGRLGFGDALILSAFTDLPDPGKSVPLLFAEADAQGNGDKRVTPQELTRALGRFDADRDGNIDDGEFARGIQAIERRVRAARP